MDTECSICLEPLATEQPSVAGKELVVLECYHALHCVCFETWLQHNAVASCPSCQSKQSMA